MSSHEHATPPPDPAPPPRRRDHESPAAGHHGPNTRLRDAWLAEMWATVREYRPGMEDGARSAELRRRGLETLWGDDPIGHSDAA